MFYNATIDLVESWRADADGFPDDLTVLADPQATVYDGLGARRKGNYVSLAHGSIGPALKAARQGRIPKLTRADMLRLGADVAVRADGEIAALHLAGSPDDRVALTELVAKL